MNILSVLNIKRGPLIGNGGFGSVYRSFDPQLKCELAVKVIPLAKFPVQTFDEYFREAAIMRDAQHKHVVPVLYSTRDNENVYLAMPLMAGGSLHDRLAAGPLSIREMIRFGLSLLSGLNHVHTRGLVHLDLKPGNVLIDEGGRAALTDFGIAKYLDPDTGTAENSGFSPLFRAPESTTTLTTTAATDIYQVGVLLYVMSLGASALESQSAGLGSRDALRAAIAAGRFPDRDALPLHLPPSLVSLIKDCLDVDPDNRPKSVLQVINRLSEIEVNLDWLPSWDGVQLNLTCPRTGAIVMARRDDKGKWDIQAHRGRNGAPAKKSFVNATGLTTHKARLQVRDALAEVDGNSRRKSR